MIYSFSENGREDTLLKRLKAWRWFSESVFKCQQTIASGYFTWTKHAEDSVHSDFKDETKTHYKSGINVHLLIKDCIENYDAIIQHRETHYLVWILKDLKEIIGYDLKTEKTCRKVVILINAESKKIVTHMPVWEFGCAKV